MRTTLFSTVNYLSDNFFENVDVLRIIAN